MRRRLLNLVTVLSLLVGLSAAALWVRGRWVSDYVWGNVVGDGTGIQSRFWEWSFVANDGIVSARGLRQVVTYTASADAAYDRQAMQLAAGWGWNTQPPEAASQPGDTFWGRMGFDLAPEGRRFHLRKTMLGDQLVGDRDVVRDELSINVPLWAIVLVTTTPPAVSAYRRRLRRAAGMCPSCGYDLRATPDRCPECGTVASVSAVE